MINSQVRNKVEVQLIQEDLFQLLLAYKRLSSLSEEGGYLAFAILPMVGFVLDEVLNYLNKNKIAYLIEDSNEELNRIHHRLKKIRAQIKLFDNTEGYSDGLIKALSLAHTKSKLFFSKSHKGWRAWVRFVQPDLGVFFKDQFLINTTQTKIPSLGFSLKELEKLPPEKLPLETQEQCKKYGYELGEILGELASVFKINSLSVDFYEQKNDKLNISHNDFVGKIFYQEVAHLLELESDNLASSLVMALAQINTVLYVLPELINKESNLLFRMRFLTAYHSSVVLTQCLRKDFFLNQELLTFLQNKFLRNTCAHYGIRMKDWDFEESGCFFSNIVEHNTSLGFEEAQHKISKVLHLMSKYLTDKVSKKSLARKKSIWGSNT